MDNLSERQMTGPSIASAVSLYWWVVLPLALLFGVIGFASSKVAATSHEATATVVVQDPQGATLFATLGNEAIQPDRYVNDQVAILASTPISQAASDELHAAGFDVSVGDIVDNTSIRTSEGSNVIVITYTAADADLARAAVNSQLEAYEDFVEARAAGGFERALNELDASLAVVKLEIAAVEAEVSVVVLGESLRGRLVETIDRIVALQDEFPTASELRRTAIRQDFTDLEGQLDRYQAVLATQLGTPQSATLSERLGEAVKRESDLLRDRSALVVDAALVQSGIAQASPALRAAAVGPSPPLAILAGIILGAVLGATFAYWRIQRPARPSRPRDRESRRRRYTRRPTFKDRLAPATVLDAPLLAEVPLPSAVSDTSEWVVASPDSAAARSFLLLSRALAEQLSALRASGSPLTEESGEDPGEILAVVSANSARQRAGVSVYTALATVRAGARVLIVDGGYERGWSTEFLSALEPVLLSGDIPEAAEGSDALTIRGEIEFDNGSHQLDVMGLRNANDSPSEVFGSSVVTTRFHDMALDYDLVLIDVPPLLTTAHAGMEVSQADYAMVVIPHGSPIDDVGELSKRFARLGVDPLGYVYVDERAHEPSTHRPGGDRLDA